MQTAENSKSRYDFGNAYYMRFVHETLVPHQIKENKIKKEKEKEK